jgi:hypothetical protein
MKRIKRLEDYVLLKIGEKFRVGSMIDLPVKYIGKADDELIGGRIFEEKGEEIVRLHKYSEGGSHTLTICSYENIRKGEKRYDELYGVLEEKR